MAAHLTYITLNLAMLTILGTGLYAMHLTGYRYSKLSVKQLFWSFVVLAVLTTTFDNVAIANHIFEYQSRHMSGLKIGLAPIEDYAYVIGALMIIPWLWHRTVRKNRKEH